MLSSSTRRIDELRREDLLDDYGRIAKQRGDAIVSTALRTKSVSMRDILVHLAIRQSLTSEELKQRVLNGTFLETEVVNVRALGDLGRLVLLQNLLERDSEYGEKLLTIAHSLAIGDELSTDTRRVLIQHHVLSGDYEAATGLLDGSPDIDQDEYGYLRSELINPFTSGDHAEYGEWLTNFNRFFEEHGYAPVFLEGNNSQPFDRLVTNVEARSAGSVDSSPLVSIVLTAYEPDAERLTSSVKSILNQTWENIELIVVDDCSGPHFKDLFDQISELDERVRVLQTPRNGGTYVARNIGYAAANGEFITGQDDDDWSHPQRIVRQVEFMVNHPEYIGCRITAIRCDEDLGRTRIGYKPVVLNPSSLLLRRAGYEQAGNYLESRKGADSEYYFRLKTVSGGKVANLKEPLSIIRILGESLSRGDFSAGWRHPSRGSFRSSYRYWHRHSSQEDLKIWSDSSPAVKVPHRFAVEPTSAPTELDVVFAGDWERYGGPQKSMLEEIHALVEANYRVGILDLEAARFMSEGASGALNDEIQKLINDGVVEEAMYDDETRVRLLILRYPPILQFFTHETSSLDIESMVIVANQAPSELDGTDIRYLVDDCHKNAECSFGVTPVWAPQGPQVRDFLELYLKPPRLSRHDIPGILDLEQWWHKRLWYRSTVPVVGRHSRDDVMKWPASEATIKELYRTDGEYDVRIMGGHKTPLSVLGSSSVPAAWTVYKKDAMPVTGFLSSLDYFVFFQHPQAVEAFGRAILEALGSGTVVILPYQFERVFGEAALYADPLEVRDLIQRLHSDFSKYETQIERSKAVLSEGFSYSSYQQLVGGLLNGSSL